MTADRHSLPHVGTLRYAHSLFLGEVTNRVNEEGMLETDETRSIQGCDCTGDVGQEERNAINLILYTPRVTSFGRSTGTGGGGEETGERHGTRGE